MDSAVSNSAEIAFFEVGRSQFNVPERNEHHAGCQNRDKKKVAQQEGSGGAHQKEQQRQGRR